ncbi:MAG: hypothetical protein UU47_C0003G0022 [candidate division TM6 bacterium GW2011_GWE2_41_16]|nr:MAG: hypothetical protein UU47_C0003G0022 [candidate division TM6 bacterium GW2011_GWE2_41_16]
MNDRISFNRWLWSKLYLINIGSALTITFLMFLFNNFRMPSPPLNTVFYIAFIIALAYAIFEILKKTPLTTIQKSEFRSKLFDKLTLKYAGVLGIYWICVLLIGGSFAAFIIWGLVHPFFLDNIVPSFLIIPLIYPLGIGWFIAMMFEESYNLTRLYEQKLTTQKLFTIITWAAFCTIMFITITMIIIKHIGHEGDSEQIAIATGIVLVKLIRPLGSRKFILGL